MSITRLGKSARLSNAVVANNIVYLTGQVGKLHEDLAGQCRTALAAVDSLLTASGTDRSRILDARILLSDINDFDAMNVIWESWIDVNNPPARSTYEARLTNPGYRVEFIITASL